jgi:hypothetical protein
MVQGLVIQYHTNRPQAKRRIQVVKVKVSSEGIAPSPLLVKVLELDSRKMISLFKKALDYGAKGPKTAAGEHSPIR